MSDKLPPKILIISTDEALSTSLGKIIERQHFNIEKLTNHRFIHNLVSKINAIIFDSELKGESLTKIIKYIRAVPNFERLPIIFLLEKDKIEEQQNLIMTYQLTEILPKFAASDVLMRVIKSLLRRANTVLQNKIIQHEKIRLDLATYTVFHYDRLIRVGPTEFKILQLLIQSPDTIYSREQIINHTWGENGMIKSRTVDVHINRIRRLIKIDKKDDQFIKTVRSSGYCLNLPNNN